ncbi:MAG: tRNA pseudouridine(55) synthase TruB [Cytophagales bacterium]
MSAVARAASEAYLLLLDKPLGSSSFYAIKVAKKRLGLPKIGHGGTLDLLAEGLLITCVGPFTKQISRYQAMTKVYEGSIVLGNTTPSYDLETPFEGARPYGDVTEASLQKALLSFVGKIAQRPPVYSAIKVKGERSYRKARRGDSFTLPPREVTVHAFEITRFKLPEIDFRITCSKGVYIRSLAHDLGQTLGTGGYLARLRRTQIGPYRLEDAYDPTKLTSPLLPHQRGVFYKEDVAVDLPCG